VGKSTHEGGKNALHKVGNGLSPKSSSEEVLIRKYSSEEGAGASDRTIVSEDSKIKAAEAKAEAERKTARDRAERIRKAISELPDFGDADIAKVTKTNLVEVQQIRNGSTSTFHRHGQLQSRGPGSGV
jgi:hypothetical protein